MTKELIEQCAKADENDTVDFRLMSSIEIIFKSLSCINGSFLSLNGGHMNCSMKNHGINIKSATAAFHLIQTVKKQTLKSVVGVLRLSASYVLHFWFSIFIFRYGTV